MKRKAFCCGTSLWIIALGSGCQMTGLLQENNERLKTTSQAIATNTATVAATTQTMQDLQSALQPGGSLKEPMQDLAALGPTFNQVAALEGPMKDLAGLQDPMTQLSALRAPLEQVAKLDKPMSDLARLEEPLKAVGQLSRPVSALTRLTPMQIAASAILTVLAFFTLLFLTIWAAVRLALRHRPA